MILVIVFYFLDTREIMQDPFLLTTETNHPKSTILAIDWWKKRFWLAYNRADNSVVFPIGSLDNDEVVLYNIAHIVAQYNISKVIIWAPWHQEDLQNHIDVFVKNLSFVLPSNCSIEKVNEDYSSVQANAHIGVYKKTAAEDSLAAVYILEEYRKKEQKIL